MLKLAVLLCYHPNEAQCRCCRYHLKKRARRVKIRERVHGSHFHALNITEQCTEWNIKVHINFVDLEKAFDNIHRNTLWNIQLAYGCTGKIVSVVKHFHNNFSCYL